MAENKDERKAAEKRYAIIGELVLLASAIDYLSAQILVRLLDLGGAHMAMLVVMTIDPRQKFEILKARAKLMPKGKWREATMDFADLSERVSKKRNDACHSQQIYEHEAWKLRSFAAAKVFKNLNLEKKQLKMISFDDLRDAIPMGERALGIGSELLKNLDRFREEKAKRAAAK